MNDIMKTVKSLEISDLLKQKVSKKKKKKKKIKIKKKNEAKEQKGEFLRMLLGNLDAILLGNLLTGKDKIRAGEGTIRAVENF